MVKKKIEKSQNTAPKDKRGRSKQQSQQIVESASHVPIEFLNPEMLTAILPMIMMIMMLAILKPMLNGTTPND